MKPHEMSCGLELAGDAEVSELLGELWEHLAADMMAHARWVGTATPDAAAEHDYLRSIAAECRNIAAAAERAAVLMKSMASLAAAPHDWARVDRNQKASFLRRKIELQLSFAEQLVRHAEASRSAWHELELEADVGA